MKTRRILFTLAILLVTAPFAVHAQAHSGGDSDPDLIEIRKYPLSMDKIEKLVSATQAMNQYVDSHPAVKERDTGSSDDMSLDQKVKYFDATFPEAVTILKQNGLSSRDYFVVSLAFLNDFSFVALKRQGTIKDYPANTVTAQNAAFVEANFDKLQEMSKKLTPPDKD